MKSSRCTPLTLHETGTKITLVGRCSNDGILHIEITVVGVDAPMFVHKPSGLHLDALVLEFARVDILTLDGLDDVVGLDVIEVEAVGKATVQHTMAPREFVTHQAFGFEVGVRRRIKVHLTHCGLAETFADHRLDFAGFHRTNHNASLRNPFTACDGVVVITDACIDGKPREDILSQIDIDSIFVVVNMRALLILCFKHFARLAAGIIGTSVDVLVIGSDSEATACPKVRTLIPAHTSEGILRAEITALRLTSIGTITIVDLMASEVIVSADASFGAGIMILDADVGYTTRNPLVSLKHLGTHSSGIGGIEVGDVGIGKDIPM